ncbi:MAG: hypothetical protein LIO96_09880 [Lachnospiraceae bacterium]|nr:hypothetical protein [Lachnospiraceae bacterium]
MEDKIKNMEGIQKLLTSRNAEKYALVNPKLSALDEYGRLLYLKMLGTVVQYENDPTEMQTLFLGRIVNGIGAEEPMEEYMRRALEITETDVDEFLTSMRKKQVRYYFVLDALILSALGAGTKENEEYLAQLAELLDVRLDEFEYLCLVAKSVLMQDSACYDAAKGKVTERTKHVDAAPYIKEFYAGAVVDTLTEKHYTAPEKKLSKGIIFPTLYKERKVVFENLAITITDDWVFDGCEEVVFRNCDFSSTGGNLQFNAIGKVVMEHCAAKDFNNRAGYLSSVNNFEVKNCEFINCGVTCDSDAHGGVFLLNSGVYDNLILIENQLLNCYVQTRSNAYPREAYGVFVSGRGYMNINDMVKIIANAFSGCKCINQNSIRGLREAAVGYFDCQKAEIEGNTFTGELKYLGAVR